MTAPAIFGGINVTMAGIYGIIQTTVGDIGSATYNASGTLTVVCIRAQGAITGEILARGNLISTVTTASSFSGVIAAQGNLGIIKHQCQWHRHPDQDFVDGIWQREHQWQ